jgi:hypothetical protein
LCYCVVLYFEGEEVINLISMDKKYKTRDGRDVRVLCVDACEGHYPVVAVVDNEAWQMTKFGAFSAIDFTGNDLVEVPEEKTVWLEIYRYKYWGDADCDSIRYHNNLSDLKEHIKIMGENSGRYKLIAIKKITYVEGEGIE